MPDTHDAAVLHSPAGSRAGHEVGTGGSPGGQPTKRGNRAADVAAFAKNAGPQSLRIDYLAQGIRLAFYLPDFFVRATNGTHYLVETKGQVDKETAAKARAALEWCKAASTKQKRWEYVYVPEGVFQRFQGSLFSELARMCAPSLHDLINEQKFAEELPLFAGIGILEGKAQEAQGLIDEKVLTALPERLRKAAEESVSLYRFFEKKPGVNYAPVFTALLGVIDESAKGLLIQKLTPKMPTSALDQKTWFEPYLAGVDKRMVRHYEEVARNLRKTLVYKNGLSPLGLLRSTLDYALNDNTKLTGVFEAAKNEFRFSGARDLLDEVTKINDLRNTRVAHQEQPLDKPGEAKAALAQWVTTLADLWAEQEDTAFSAGCAVNLSRFRSKGDQDSDFLAELDIVLPHLNLPKSPEAALVRKLRETAERQIQPAANHHFGPGKVHVTCTEVRSGSIELKIILSVLLAGAFSFVRDYDKIRANTMLFAGDMKHNCGKLGRAIKHILGGSDNPFGPKK